MPEWLRELLKEDMKAWAFGAACIVVWIIIRSL